MALSFFRDLTHLHIDLDGAADDIEEQQASSLVDESSDDLAAGLDIDTWMEEHLQGFETLKSRISTPDLSDAIDRKLEELKHAVQARQIAIERRLAAPPAIKLLHKVSFFFGVSNITLTTIFICLRPEWIPLWYISGLIALLSWRIYAYRKIKEHYFLLDFCYFANAILVLALFFLPEQRWLYQTSFAYAFGPLAHAVHMWRNSLVFHSIDKLTSVYIHMFPPLTLFTLRFMTLDGWRYFCTTPDCSDVSVRDMMVWPLGCYLVWQVSYALYVEIMSAEKVKARGYVTSFNYMSSSGQRKVILEKYGRAMALLMFMFSQLAYTVLTMAPAVLFLRYVWVSLAFLAAISGVCVWNGATFYIEVFSKRYIRELEADSAAHADAPPASAAAAPPAEAKPKAA